MKTGVRVSTKAKDFNPFMNRTDDLQLKIVAPSTDPNYKRYGWSDDQSQQWTSFRKQSNLIFTDYNDPDKVGPTIRKKMRELIKQTRAYDNNKMLGNFLLDKVASNGNIDDWKTFNIKRGTVLSEPKSDEKKDTSAYTPTLTSAKIGFGFHVFSVRCTETPDSRGLPEGMAFVLVFRCISATPPTKLSQYDQVGAAKFGKFISNFSELVPVPGEKLIGYYYARYMSTKGVLGNPGPIAKVPVNLVEV